MILWRPAQEGGRIGRKRNPITWTVTFTKRDAWLLRNAARLERKKPEECIRQAVKLWLSRERRIPTDSPNPRYRPDPPGKKRG